MKILKLKILKIKKQIEELNQEIKFANKEKTLALTKARDSLKAESEKIRAEAKNVYFENGNCDPIFYQINMILKLKEKQEELSKYKKIIKELEDEIQRLKIEQHQNVEKDREFIINVEKLEKNLIKDINEEQRKLSALIPGLMPKLVNYSK